MYVCICNGVNVRISSTFEIDDKQPQLLKAVRLYVFDVKCNSIILYYQDY